MPKKAKELQGPTKIKKVSLKDFKFDAKITKYKKDSDEKNVNKLKQYDNIVLPYKGVVNEKKNDIHFLFYRPVTE
jgi:hypothetical protein